MKKNLLLLFLLTGVCSSTLASDGEQSPSHTGSSANGRLFSDGESDGTQSRPETPRTDKSLQKPWWQWSSEGKAIQNKLQAIGFNVACLKAVDAPIVFGAHVAKVHGLATGKPLQKAHAPAASVTTATLRALFDMTTPLLVTAEAFAQHQQGRGKQTATTMGLGILTSAVVLVNLILHGLSHKTLHLKGARLQAFRAGIQSYTKGLGTWVATQIGLAGVQLTIDELLAIITADSWRRGHDDLLNEENWATGRYTFICLLTIAKNLLDIGKRIPQVSMVEDMVKRGAPVVGLS